MKTVQFFGDFLDELPNFHIDTFSSLKNIQEDLPKSRKVMLKNSLRGKKMQTLKTTFLVEERHEIREIEKISPTELDTYLSQFVLAARTKTGKDYEPSSLREILASVERHLSRSSYGKTIFKDSDFKKQETR